MYLLVDLGSFDGIKKLLQPYRNENTVTTCVSAPQDNLSATSSRPDDNHLDCTDRS